MMVRLRGSGGSESTGFMRTAAPTRLTAIHATSEPSGHFEQEGSNALLGALDKKQLEDVRVSRVATLAEIADREGLCERHVRRLAPLASLCLTSLGRSPTAARPATLTDRSLAKAVPFRGRRHRALRQLDRQAHNLK